MTINRRRGKAASKQASARHAAQEAARRAAQAAREQEERDRPRKEAAALIAGCGRGAHSFSWRTGEHSAACNAARIDGVWWTRDIHGTDQVQNEAALRVLNALPRDTKLAALWTAQDGPGPWWWEAAALE